MGLKEPPHNRLARAADNMALLLWRWHASRDVAFSITAERQEGIKEGGAVETCSTFYSGKVNSWGGEEEVEEEEEEGEAVEEEGEEGEQRREVTHRPHIFKVHS